MKAIMFLTLLICSACNDHTVIPSFKSNSSLEHISENIRDIIESKEVTIAFTPQGDLDYGLTKLFCFSNGVWEKIEVRTNIVELDTILSKTELGLIHKDEFLRYKCRESEASSFLHKLTNHHLFELPEEKILIEKCNTGTSAITHYDAGAVVFEIIKGSRVRKLRYTYPWYRIEDCPNVAEWNDILALKALFEDEWYAKEHWCNEMKSRSTDRKSIQG
ncbi:MAG TPA: hypothetical protein VIM65_19320 [Cyclobacteriaceae bacterium]